MERKSELGSNLFVWMEICELGSQALANVEMAIAEWLKTDRLRSMQMEKENIQEKMVQYILDKNSKSTEEQEKRLKKVTKKR